jgi:hypothetical protein
VKLNGGIYCLPRKRASEQKRCGYALVELLVVALIVILTMTVGQGFAKLSALEDRNREKAVTLEKLCDRFAWTQPYAAVGRGALNVVSTQVDITYPDIVSGIACETNRFVQVTNCTLRVRSDGALQAVVQAGKVAGLNGVTNTMDWMDVGFAKHGLPALASSQATQVSDYLMMRYEVTNVYDDTVQMSMNGTVVRVDTYTNVVLTVPVKLWNSAL